MLFYDATNSYTGFYATRSDAGSWSREKFPIPVATASLVIGADGSPVALVNDGTLPGTSLWRRGSLGWSRLDSGDLGDYEAYDAPSLVATSDGCFHAALLERQLYPAYGLWNGKWNVTSMGYSARGGIAPGLALGLDGTVNLAVWMYSSAATGSIEWLARGHDREVIDGASAPFDAVRASITVVPAETNTPYVFYRALAANGGAQPSANLTVAWRRSEGGWKHRVVAAPVGTTAEDCGQATPSSQNCVVDYVDVAPVAILSSGDGGVRMFYTSTRERATLVPSCSMPPVDSCSFSRTNGKSDAELDMAWFNGDGSVARTILARSSNPGAGRLSASVVLDESGRIHIAVFDGATHSTVRYLRFAL